MDNDLLLCCKDLPTEVIEVLYETIMHIKQYDWKVFWTAPHWQLNEHVRLTFFHYCLKCKIRNSFDPKIGFPSWYNDSDK